MILVSPFPINKNTLVVFSSEQQHSNHLLLDLVSSSSYFPFGFEGRMWDLIVSVPDHCLSFYFSTRPLVESLLFSWYLWKVVRSSWKYLWFKYSLIHVFLPATTIFTLYILSFRNMIIHYAVYIYMPAFLKIWQSSLVHRVSRSRVSHYYISLFFLESHWICRVEVQRWKDNTVDFWTWYMYNVYETVDTRCIRATYERVQ